MKANQDIRAYMEKNNIYMWQIGLKLGRSENTMIRRLRVELSPEDKKQMFSVMSEIVKERD